jgi:hypothetical protein
VIVKFGPNPKPEAPSCPPEAAPLPSAPARSVAPWRVAAVAGLLVLAFFLVYIFILQCGIFYILSHYLLPTLLW